MDLDASVDFHSLFRILPNLDDDPRRGLPAFAYEHTAIPRIVSTHQPVDELPRDQARLFASLPAGYPGFQLFSA